MFNMKKLIFLSGCAVGLFIIGCSKDGSDDNGDGPSEKMQLITSAAWKYDTAVVEFAGSTYAIPSGLLLSCDKDNIITLRDDSTGTVDEGPSKCEGGDPQSYDITWEFRNNETVINMPQTLYGISGEIQIKELTASKLKLARPIKIENPLGPTPDSITVNAIVDLKH
jgi:hypothetical protein